MPDANNAVFFYYISIKRKQTKPKENSTMNNPIMHYQLGKIRSRELIRRRELEAAAAAWRRANTNATGKSGLSNGHKLAIALSSVVFAIMLIAQLVAV